MEPCRYIARTFLFITIKHLQTNMYSTKKQKRNPANSTATKVGGGGKKKKEDQFFSFLPTRSERYSNRKKKKKDPSWSRSKRYNELISLTVVVMQVEEDERTTTMRFWLWSLEAIVDTAAWLASPWVSWALLDPALELVLPVATLLPREVCLITRTLPAGSNTTTCLILATLF